MSENLKLFYQDYAKWLKSDAPTENSCFHRHFGLCTNLSYWCRTKGFTSRTLEHLLEEMYNQFQTEGLYPSYPFNEGNRCYHYEFVRSISYLNEKRRKWVFDHA